jgi:hypothetical protein
MDTNIYMMWPVYPVAYIQRSVRAQQEHIMACGKKNKYLNMRTMNLMFDKYIFIITLSIYKYLFMNICIFTNMLYLNIFYAWTDPYMHVQAHV